MPSEKFMSFEEFLALIRERIGNYCTDAYWKWKYETLPDKSQGFIEKELSFLAVHAIGTDYASKESL